MGVIQIHIAAIQKVIDDLSKGKYLLFFIPGILVGLIFFQVFFVSSTVQSSLSFIESIPLIGSFLNWILDGIFGIIQFILTFIFTFFVLTLLSPFNTILSERIDEEQTGKKYAFNLSLILADLVRMIFLVIICLFLELIVAGLYWMVSGIFGLGFIDKIVFFIISSFFYGLTFYDYSLERYRFGIGASMKFSFTNMALVTVTGSIFSLIYMIPGIGVIISPVIATMIATHIFINLQNNKL